MGNISQRFGEGVDRDDKITQIGFDDGYQVDGVHPAAAGYMLIARAWKERIVK